MADKGTKLFKIATQINIGRDAIVEYLVSKGFSIENKATAVLTDEMVDVVTDKFAKGFEVCREGARKEWRAITSGRTQGTSRPNAAQRSMAARCSGRASGRCPEFELVAVTVATMAVVPAQVHVHGEAGSWTRRTARQGAAAVPLIAPATVRLEAEQLEDLLHA